ncbi:MAG: hypothetical protein QOF49_23 [Chloroflexota bacterium]|nr:hypothetical protein [Chloroflexota bacterium]
MRVRQLRLARGWSQAQLAELSGLSVRTIQRIENGANPGLESLTNLAAVLEVDVADLQLETPGRRRPMSLGEAVSHCLRNYDDFTGAARRPELWWFSLAVVAAVSIGAAIAPWLGEVVALVALVPWLAAAARRMRDAGHNPWWLLMLFAPVGGLVVVVVLLALPSTADRDLAKGLGESRS